MYRLQYEQTIN